MTDTTSKHVAFAVAQFMTAARSHKHGMAALIVAGIDMMLPKDEGKVKGFTPTKAAMVLSETFVKALNEKMPLADSTKRNYLNWSDAIIGYGLKRLETAGLVTGDNHFVATQAEYDALLALHEAACNDALAAGEPKPEWAAPLVAETILDPLGNSLREMSDATDPRKQEKRDIAKAKREKEKADADAAKAEAAAKAATVKAGEKSDAAEGAAQSLEAAENASQIGDVVQGPDYAKMINALLAGMRSGAIDKAELGQSLQVLAEAAIDYIAAPVADKAVA